MAKTTKLVLNDSIKITESEGRTKKFPNWISRLLETFARIAKPFTYLVRPRVFIVVMLIVFVAINGLFFSGDLNKTFIPLYAADASFLLAMVAIHSILKTR